MKTKRKKKREFLERSSFLQYISQRKEQIDLIGWAGIFRVFVIFLFSFIVLKRETLIFISLLFSIFSIYIVLFKKMQLEVVLQVFVLSFPISFFVQILLKLLLKRFFSWSFLRVLSFDLFYVSFCCFLCSLFFVFLFESFLSLHKKEFSSNYFIVINILEFSLFFNFFLLFSPYLWPLIDFLG